MFSFSKNQLSPATALEREWIVANGLGGYASSSVIGMNTRKYHGLLVAAAGSPAERVLLLSKIEESVLVDGKEHFLSTNKYPGVIHPEGYKHMTGFSFDTYPTFLFEVDGVKVEKKVRMARGRNATVISYRVSSKKEAELRLRPLINGRDIHSNTTNPACEFSSSGSGFAVKKPYPFWVEIDRGAFVKNELAYNNMEYEWETRRMTGDRDDHFSPGYFSVETMNGEANLLASDEQLSVYKVLSEACEEEKRLKELIGQYYRTSRVEKSEFCDTLVISSDSFIVKRGDLYSVVAGYHWFGDWGRDALISLPGLALVTGRHKEAKDMLLLFAKTMKGGLIRNTFDRMPGNEYKGADPSLLFINDVFQFLKHTEDYIFVRRSFWLKMKGIIDSYRNGTEGVRMDGDGLIVTLADGLTWMDTLPRKGKPVEINALWYNALCIMEALAKQFGDEDERGYGKMAEDVKKGFKRFWNEEEECLFDVIDPADASIRPNQIFAVSLPFSPLNEEQKRAVFERVKSDLYAPFGLLSLSKKNPMFKDEYKGGQPERDAAYHNGAIWPWLIGPFTDAHKHIYPKEFEERRKFIEPFISHLPYGCLGGIGSIAEIFEPKTSMPRGCVSQAWSVAEILRAYSELGAISKP
jgi:predicted glycogen debranching enzyme